MPRRLQTSPSTRCPSPSAGSQRGRSQFSSSRGVTTYAALGRLAVRACGTGVIQGSSCSQLTVEADSQHAGGSSPAATG